MAETKKALNRIFFAGIMVFLVVVVAISVAAKVYNNRDAAVAAQILMVLAFACIMAFLCVQILRAFKAKREGRPYELLTVFQSLVIFATELTYLLVRLFAGKLIG